MSNLFLETHVAIVSGNLPTDGLHFTMTAVHQRSVPLRQRLLRLEKRIIPRSLQ